MHVLESVSYEYALGKRERASEGERVKERDGEKGGKRERKRELERN